MIAAFIAFMPLVLKIAPLLFTLFISDKEKKREALDNFKAWVQKHENDGVLSGSLRKEGAKQKDTLAEQAKARDAAAIVTAAALAQMPASGPVVSPAGQAGPTGNLGAPQGVSTVPHVKGPA